MRCLEPAEKGGNGRKLDEASGNVGKRVASWDKGWRGKRKDYLPLGTKLFFGNHVSGEEGKRSGAEIEKTCGRGEKG